MSEYQYYEWGDFKHDPTQVLAKYFDAHLYLTNWGTRHLAFRFPKGLVDARAVESYCDEDHVKLKVTGSVQVLEFEMNEEEALAEKYKGRTSLIGRWKKKGWL
ncbi:MAG TPA: hypothetical protein VK249_20195 [Anaerolineales bacterium]|nr:hypothetical protein [Anaerolineales bacterium]